MRQKPEPAPFEVHDRLEYLGESSIEAPAAVGGETADTLLKPGMRGTVVYSKPGWIDPRSGKSQPAHCRIKFDNGYEFTINSENKNRFKNLTQARKLENEEGAYFVANQIIQPTSDHGTPGPDKPKIQTRLKAEQAPPPPWVTG